MIIFNDRFSFTRDKYCWHLIETYEGKTRDGKPKKQKKTTYHTSLEQVFTAIVDRTAGDCGDMEELREMLKKQIVVLAENAA